VGAGDLAEIARVYFESDGWRVAAFAVDGEYRNADTFDGLPLLDLRGLEKKHPPSAFGAFVAIGYGGMNRGRRRKFEEMKRRGYALASYVSPRAVSFAKVGENCLVLEHNTLQPRSVVGDDVILWSGNHVGHHAEIADHAFVSSHVVISGRARIGERCFLGVNSTIRDGVSLGEGTFVGAGALVTRNTSPGEVWKAAASSRASLSSDELRRI
jgi:sugar O-acyltransferase (sialic acid O-acetyltransferase NeuD family)